MRKACKSPLLKRKNKDKRNIYQYVYSTYHIKWKCIAMGDQLFMNASILSCNSAVKCSILYISWILSLHWVIVGSCGFSQEDVITLFAIRRRALRSFVWLFSSRLSGNIPKIKCDGSNGMSINKHVLFPFVSSILITLDSPKIYVCGLPPCHNPSNIVLR